MICLTVMMGILAPSASSVRSARKVPWRSVKNDDVLLKIKMESAYGCMWWDFLLHKAMVQLGLIKVDGMQYVLCSMSIFS